MRRERSWNSAIASSRYRSASNISSSLRHRSATSTGNGAIWCGNWLGVFQGFNKIIIYNFTIIDYLFISGYFYDNFFLLYFLMVRILHVLCIGSDCVAI